jgi:hypothetical protein
MMMIYKLMFMAANAVVSSGSDSQVNSSAPLPAKRGAPSMVGVAKKGPASVLSRLNPDYPKGIWRKAIFCFCKNK